MIITAPIVADAAINRSPVLSLNIALNLLQWLHKSIDIAFVGSLLRPDKAGLAVDLLLVLRVMPEAGMPQGLPMPAPAVRLGRCVGSSPLALGCWHPVQQKYMRTAGGVPRSGAVCWVALSFGELVCVRQHLNSVSVAMLQIVV